MAVMRYQPQGRIRLRQSHPLLSGLQFAYVATSTNRFAGYSAPGASVSDSSTTSGVRITRVGVGRFATAPSVPVAQVVTPNLNTADYSLFAFGTATNSSGSNANNAIDDDTGGGVGRRMQFRLDGGAVQIITFSSGGSVYQAKHTAVLTLEQQAAGVAMGATVTPSKIAAFQNGTKAESAVSGSVPLSGNVTIGASKQAAAQSWVGGALSLVMAWNRALTDDEHKSLADNPWQLFEDASDEDEMSFAAAVVAVGGTATPVGVGGSALVGIASGSAGARSSPAGVAATTTVGAVSASAGARAAPPGVSAAASVGIASASAGASGTASPIGVAAIASVGAPTASAGATVAPAGVGALTQVGTATATGGTASTAAPAGVSAAASVGQSSATGGASAAPQGVTAWASAGLATASAGINGIATPAGVGASASVGTPVGSGGAACAPAGVSASALVGGVTASAGTAGTAAPAGVGAAASIGSAAASAGASCTPAGVAVFTSVGAVIAAGTISIPATAAPVGVTAYARVGSASALGGGIFARAPSGSGYAPQRNEHQVRPVQSDGARPSATEKAYR